MANEAVATVGPGAIIGYIVGAIGGGKTIYDIWNGIRKTNSDTDKNEKDAQNTAINSMASAATAGANASNQWMKNYADLLEKFGAVNERLNQQSTEIEHLKVSVDSLKEKLDGKDKELQISLAAGKEKDGIILDRDRRIGKQEQEVIAARREAAEWQNTAGIYISGFASVMFLNSVAAGKERADQAQIAMAQASVNNTTDYDAERRQKEKAAEWTGVERRGITALHQTIDGERGNQEQ